MEFQITLLPGDGIGPEVVGEAVRVLEVAAGKYKHSFKFTERLMGGCSIDKFGSSLTDETLADCQSADAVLLGAVGGPKWDDPSAKDRPEIEGPRDASAHREEEAGACPSHALQEAAPVDAVVEV